MLPDTKQGTNTRQIQRHAALQGGCAPMHNKQLCKNHVVCHNAADNTKPILDQTFMLQPCHNMEKALLLLFVAVVYKWGQHVVAGDETPEVICAACLSDAWLNLGQVCLHLGNQDPAWDSGSWGRYPCSESRSSLSSSLQTRQAIVAGPQPALLLFVE